MTLDRDMHYACSTASAASSAEVRAPFAAPYRRHPARPAYRPPARAARGQPMDRRGSWCLHLFEQVERQRRPLPRTGRDLLAGERPQIVEGGVEIGVVQEGQDRRHLGLDL